MAARSSSRGHETHWDGSQWVYSDTGKPDDGKRRCTRCGKLPTPEGHDACLGRIEGLSSACCGHGVKDPYFVKSE